MEGWQETGPSTHDREPDSGSALADKSGAPPLTVKEKLYELGWSGFDKEPHPEFAFDKTLLSTRDPLTQVEIDYINLQLEDAIRELAVAAGCAPEDAEKINAHYWYEKKCSYQNGNHVWGIFYECDQSNFDDNDLPNAPRPVAEFMRNFEHALGRVAFHESNTEKCDKGRQAVGWSSSGFRDNTAYMRGGSRDILLPVVRLIELLDPSFKLHFDVPQRYESIYDTISDHHMRQMANASDSAFWIDREWAQQELDNREAGRKWTEMQKRIDESRAEARVEARPQSLRARLKLALSNNHIAAVDPQEPHGAKSR